MISAAARPSCSRIRLSVLLIFLILALQARPGAICFSHQCSTEWDMGRAEDCHATGIWRLLCFRTAWTIRIDQT
jgi:hypothetical protein